MTDDSTRFSLTESAVGLHEMYLSLIDAGFTADDALTLVCQMLRQPGGDR